MGNILLVTTPAMSPLLHTALKNEEMKNRENNSWLDYNILEHFNILLSNTEQVQGEG